VYNGGSSLLAGNVFLWCISGHDSTVITSDLDF
jgi:hypothetical protein